MPTRTGTGENNGVICAARVASDGAGVAVDRAAIGNDEQGKATELARAHQ